MPGFKSLNGNLLAIPAGSLKVSILLVPLVYAFWLHAFALQVIENKPVKSLLLVLINTQIFLAFIITASVISYFFSPNTLDIMPIVFLFFILLSNVISAILSYHSMQYEKEQQLLIPPKIYFLDYFVRYFVLQNWWIGIWSMQKIVNRYLQIKE